MKKVHWAIIPLSTEDTSKPISESIITNMDTIPLRVIQDVYKNTNLLSAGGISSQKGITMLSLHGTTNASLIKNASESSEYNNVLEYFYEPKDVVYKTEGIISTELVFRYNLYKIHSVSFSNKLILITLVKSALNENNSKV